MLKARKMLKTCNKKKIRNSFKERGRRFSRWLTNACQWKERIWDERFNGNYSFRRKFKMATSRIVFEKVVNIVWFRECRSQNPTKSADFRAPRLRIFFVLRKSFQLKLFTLRFFFSFLILNLWIFIFRFCTSPNVQFRPPPPFVDSLFFSSVYLFVIQFTQHSVEHFPTKLVSLILILDELIDLIFFSPLHFLFFFFFYLSIDDFFTSYFIFFSVASASVLYFLPNFYSRFLSNECFGSNIHSNCFSLSVNHNFFPSILKQKNRVKGKKVKNWQEDGFWWFGCHGYRERVLIISMISGGRGRGTEAKFWVIPASARFSTSRIKLRSKIWFLIVSRRYLIPGIRLFLWKSFEIVFVRQ